jgi:hypothetical protein
MIGNNLLLGSGDEGYNLTRSLRFRSSASARLSRTPASASNRKTWTWSGWVKRGLLSSSANYALFDCQISGGATDWFTFSFRNDSISFDFATSSVSRILQASSAVYRDPSAWYHVVLAVDTTLATAADRVKVYINGSQVTSFTYAVGSGYVPQNTDLAINSTGPHSIAARNTGTPDLYFDGYLTEINLIDGQALTPSSFGETDLITGVWKPKAFSGTYGTNGFELQFTDNSAATAAAIGKDSSGNGNNWTPNNISVTAGATYDSMTDVPTLTSATAANFAVLNPITPNNYTLTNGNLSAFKPNVGAQTYNSRSTIAVSSGKWYAEFTVSGAISGNGSPMFGITNPANSANSALASFSNTFLYYGYNGFLYNNGSGVAYGATFGANDVIGIALNLDAGTLTFYKNNVSQGVATSSIAGQTFVMLVNDDQGLNSWTVAANFGQRPFTYTPPTGYVSLNTFNLPTSTIVKGNTVMDATLYTGNGSTQTVTNAAGFKPDLVWDKRRDAAGNHGLFDSVRGGGNWISSNATNAETAGVNGVTAFNSNGFSVGSHPDYNTNAATQVAWQWQAGQGSTSSNTSGTITSTVSVNASAGFSICTLTTPASGICTFGHGLGVAPSLVLTKYRSSTSDWLSYHSSVGNTAYLLLNGTNAATTNANTWNNTSPTSSVVTLGSDFSGTRSIVAYCWTPIAGYSAFGSYTGNGSTNGAFIYTGFRPRFVLVKQTDAAGNWLIWDTARSTYNQMQDYLIPNSSSQELNNVLVSIDVLSNGFKCRTADDDINGNGNSYIYMAFAENPTKFALAR